MHMSNVSFIFLQDARPASQRNEVGLILFLCVELSSGPKLVISLPPLRRLIYVKYIVGYGNHKEWANLIESTLVKFVSFELSPAFLQIW